MLKSYLIVFFISMLPLIELRGAIPVGIGMGLPILPTYLVCVVGNMLPVPFIFVVALTFAFSLDTVLDNEANNLSVGQRQLLTIARVFLADPACSFSMRRQARWTPARSRRLQRRWTR